MSKRRTKTAVSIGAVALAMGLVAACGPTLGQPAVGQRPNAPRVFDNSDPAVLVHAGATYLYGSTNNMRLPVRPISSFNGTLGQSQLDWATNPRDAMPDRPAWVDPTEWEIWAPSVTRINGAFVVYFAAKHRAATTNENNDLCIGRADATSPLGPFTPWSTPLYCGLPAEGAIAGQPASNRWGRGALDPEVVRGHDGKLHLLVALSRTRDNIGVVRLDSVGRVVGGINATPTILASQGLPWHDGTVDTTLRGHVFLENPTMAYDPQTKTYLLFYSAGQWNTSSYVTGFARCAAPTGPCTLDTRGPMLMGGNGRSGPGGLTAFRDATGLLRVAYATWTAGREGEVGLLGEYTRKTHWGRITLGSTSDPAAQRVSLS
ncbi:MAG TPA: family 43 glycosylhydrolase [Acidimicrobiales bacterium]|nr:family 43 glycosylhydrolase [Acidimicrobiales bacterium]